MRTIKLLILLFIIGTFKSYAGGVKSIEVANGIIQLRSDEHSKWAYALDDEKRNLLSSDKHLLVYDLELYTNGEEKQYCLRMGVRNIPLNIIQLKLPSACAYIPTYAKLLIKTEDDSVIELTSLINKRSSERDYHGHFFLDDSVLNKLFGGVKKIRMELINFDLETWTLQKEFRDAEYKKDKFGKDMQEAYEDLNKEYSKKEKELLKKIKVSTMTNINEGF